MCKIEFSLERPTFVIIKVVDIMGNVVGTVLKDHRKAGLHKIDFNEENLMPGRYYYKIFLCDSNQDGIEKSEYSKLWKTGKVQIDNTINNRFMDL
jgi:hypothetical protein